MGCFSVRTQSFLPSPAVHHVFWHAVTLQWWSKSDTHLLHTPQCLLRLWTLHLQKQQYSSSLLGRSRGVACMHRSVWIVHSVSICSESRRTGWHATSHAVSVAFLPFCRRGRRRRFAQQGGQIHRRASSTPWHTTSSSRCPEVAPPAGRRTR